MKKKKKNGQLFNEQIILTPPARFDFFSTIHAHGWIDLPPFTRLDGRAGFARVDALPSGAVVRLEVSAPGGYPCKEIHVEAVSDRPLDDGGRERVAAMAARMLRLDEDFSEFHALCRRRGEPWRRFARGQGRLLRCPTVFEDLVKVICTTNIQWSGTRRMLAGLVEAFGAPAPRGLWQKLFPLPRVIARASLEDFSARVRLGYRAPYIHALAGEAAAGRLDEESWLDKRLPAGELKKKLLSIKGIGAYAAASMLMLLGRYGEIPADSEFRKWMGEKYFPGEMFDLQKALAVYQDWGRWQGLAYWLEMTHG